MKKDKLFAKYFDKRCKSILTHLQQFSRNPDAEELHRIRVEIKKLKAIFYLQKKYGGYKIPAVHKKIFNRLFHQAGNIRDKQEELKLARQYHAAAESWERKRMSEINLLSAKLAQEASKYADDISFIQKKIAGKLVTIDSKDISRFFREQIKKMQEHFIQKDIFPNLHENRKLLKRILYINNLSPATQKDQEIDFTYADKLQNLIGKWHDAIVTIRLLEQPAFSTNPAPLHLRQKRLEKNIVAVADGFNDNIRLH